MEEIYWIQRISAINVLALIILIINIIITFISIFVYSADNEFIDSLESAKRNCERVKRFFRIAPWIIGITTMIFVFVPTKQELYEIYGVGGTIDYIKGNENVQQLPDKVINALDKWIDNINQEENNDE